MSSKKAGARRRALTLMSALVIAVALAALSSGAGATNECENVLGTTTFTDPTGDGSGASAPDISDVTVTSYEGGATTFQIALPDVDAFTADMLAPVVPVVDEGTTDMLVRTYIDFDKNAATGNEKGYEYMIQTVPAGVASAAGPFTAKCEDQPRSTLYTWDGSGWVAQETETLSSSYGDNSLIVTLNASEIGKALTFNFAVYAASNVSYDEAGVPDTTNASFDWAPDTGSWAYQPFEWSSYSDPSGDGSAEGAPDISKVGVTKWKGDLLKFTIPLPSIEEFAEDMLIRIPIDADNNAATGDANGYDYMIQAQRVDFDFDAESVLMGAKSALRSICYQPNVVLLEWNGEDWNGVEGSSLDWWYTKGFELSLDSSAIGSPATFSFAVYAATKVSFDESGRPDLTKEPAFDRAPDTGSYAFPLAVSNAELVGVYNVRYHVTKSTGNLGLKKAKAWSFQKRCSKKNCATKVAVKGQGNYKLSRAGKTSYKARVGKKVSCRNSATTPTTQTFSMNVKKSGWIKGKWRVTKWVGTLKVASAKKNASACGAAGSYTAALTGTLKK